MILSEKITIALCFSRPNDAQSLSERLKDIAPDIKFIISSTAAGFFATIGQEEKIDCFIIEEEFNEISGLDMITKIKSKQLYKQSVISVFSSNIAEIKTEYLELKTDYIFDFGTELKEVIETLKKCILKKMARIIAQNYNILALDNDFEMLEVISMHLNELGHENNDLCLSVNEAKKCLLEKEYDLLLLDWNLDDGTCIDLAKFIQNLPIKTRTKHAPIVVITGRDDIDDIMSLLQYGIKDHIIKPFDFKEFEDKVCYALEKAHTPSST